MIAVGVVVAVGIDFFGIAVFVVDVNGFNFFKTKAAQALSVGDVMFVFVFGGEVAAEAVVLFDFVDEAHATVY